MQYWHTVKGNFGVEVMDAHYFLVERKPLHMIFFSNFVILVHKSYIVIFTYIVILLFLRFFLLDIFYLLG